MNYNKLTSLVIFTCIMLLLISVIIIQVLKWFNIISPLESFNNRDIIMKAYKGLDEKDPDDQPEEETGSSKIIEML